MAQAKISDDKKSVIVTASQSATFLTVDGAIEAAERAIQKEWGHPSPFKIGAWTVISEREYQYKIEEQ